jgi:ribonuclease HI
VSSYHLVVSDGGYKNGLAYGSFRVFDSKGLTVTHNRFIIGLGTSNQSEYIALLNAMRWCLDNEITNAVFFTDSRLVVKQVLGEWRCINQNMRILCKKVRFVSKDFKNFEINYIPTKYVKQKLGH